MRPHSLESITIDIDIVDRTPMFRRYLQWTGEIERRYECVRSKGCSKSFSFRHT